MHVSLSVSLVVQYKIDPGLLLLRSATAGESHVEHAEGVFGQHAGGGSGASTSWSYRASAGMVRGGVGTRGGWGKGGEGESRGHWHVGDVSPSQILESTAGEHSGNTEMTSLQRGQWRPLQSRTRCGETRGRGKERKREGRGARGREKGVEM